VGLQVHVGEGHSTLLGSLTWYGITVFTAGGEVLDSSFAVSTADDGSTLVQSYSGSFAPIPDTADFTFTIDSVFGAETGRLAGLTGASTATAILDGATGTFEVEHNGTWTLP
jgi:hypothetical protein